MDDRHTFSDPRAALGHDKPTWNVDVYRKGVDDPVFTLLINSETLPPRMRKKKVVWRLPDRQDIIPNFGSDEKKRLVDLFKQQKKNRRKSTKRSGSSLEMGSGSSNAELNPADDFLDDSFTRDREIRKDRQEDERDKKRSTEITKREDMEISSVPPLTSEYHHQAFLKDNSKEEERYMGNNGTVITNDGFHEIQPPPPPGMGIFPIVPQTIPQTIHPPGDIGNASLPQGSQTPSTVSSREEESPLAGSLPPPGFTMSPLNICTIGNIGDDSNNRYLNVPITSANIPVDLAQSFMDMYYCSMTHGQQEELLLHYDHGAVKSLSLGGAHSFCKLRSEILIQLNSLQDSLWDITGVVAQDGFHNSVVLLITGSALPKTSLHPIPFCHTVTLVKNPMGYQIHNDAMSLMTPNNLGIGGGGC